MAKPLKIVGRSVVPGEAKASPAPLAFPTKPKAKPLSPKGKAAIRILVDSRGKTSVSAAMRAAGYSPATAKNPKNLTETREYQEEMRRFVVDLVQHRRKVLDRMDETIDDADYGKLTSALDTVTRNVQLLTGRATGRLGLSLPDEEKREIEALLGINSGPR
jgi:hypothetical protein